MSYIMNQENKKAVIYCRVSTKEQVDEGNSLVTQEKNCREYAAKNGYEVIQIFVEQGESAKTTDRTELRKLMSFCALKKNGVCVVIAYKIDRISRNTDDYSQIRIILKKHGVQIKSTSEHFENTPAGRFMENIIANVAQFDNDVRAERSIVGMRQALVEGRYVWMAPLGYSNVKIDGKSTITPNQLAESIKEAFELIATKKLSVNETRIYISTKGICKKDGSPIGKSHFYQLLDNKIYIGKVHKFSEVFQGKFPALISENLFNAVQSIVKRKNKSKVYEVENPDFPLRRFVFSESNRVVSGGWCRGRTKKYPYYRFSDEKRSFKKSKFESNFSGFLNKFQLNEELTQKFKEAIISILKADNEAKLNSDNTGPIQRQNELLNRKKLLVDKSLSGTLPDSIVKEELEIITQELAEIEIKTQQKKETIIDSDLIFINLQKILTNPGLFWESQPFEIQRRLQWFEFPSGVIFDGNDFRTTKICSIFKVKDTILDYVSTNVHHPDRKNKLPSIDILPPLKREELIALLKDVEKEIIILNEHILKPSNIREYNDTS